MNPEIPTAMTTSRPQWRRMGAGLGALPLAALLVFANPVGASPTDKAGGPPGNNGTVKIDRAPFDSHPDNQPHVGCDFEVDFYGFDEGDVYAKVTFAVQPPTGKAKELLTDDVFIGEDDNSGGGSEAGHDAHQPYNLTQYLVGHYQEHPQQGYHVKLTVNADGSQGADTKHKVFWVRGCTTTPNAETKPETKPDTKPETKSETVAVRPANGSAPNVLGVAITNPATAGPGTTVLGEQLVQAPAPVGGVQTGGGGTSQRSNDLLPLMAGLGCVGLVSFATTRLRRRIV